MESQQLHQWTLAVHAEAAALECHLSDGRRLDWRVQRPVRPGHLSPAPATAAALLGAELADRLASSAPRFLAVLYASTGPLDAVDWEHLDLGGFRLAEHFCMGRQLLSDADTPSPAGVALVDELCTGLVCGAGFGARRWPTGYRVPFDALHQPAHRQALSSAHVLVLDGITLAAWLQNTRWLHGQRLLVVLGAQGLPGLASALDAGAAVLCLAPADASTDDTLAALLHQLGRGQSIGEAVRWLHRRADAARLQARLYGDPGLRFVRAQAPASRRQVTSLSFDLVGSTTLLAAVGDEAYAETLARVHARCTDIVRSHGGQADDPQGDDGVMSYFGHPAAIEDAAVRAVEAGLCIVQAVADLGVVVRVGIATGLVAIKAGQPVGLSVHQAARLQQVAEPGTVQVAHSTQQLIAHAFDLALRADAPLLKGIDPAEALYVVTGLRSDIQEHRLERASALTPMRSEERRVGKECRSLCRSRWSPYH